MKDAYLSPTIANINSIFSPVKSKILAMSTWENTLL